MSRSDAPLNENDVNCKLPDRPADPDVILNRTKKGRKKAKLPDAAEVTARPEDYIRIAPAPRDDTIPQQEGLPVQLSQKDKANQLQLSDDKLSVTGWKGFRTVRSTRGVFTGTWFCEVNITHLGETGHCRLGWCTKKAELQAPVGFDAFGFSYRDIDGTKVHKSWRETYGSGFKEGDVIGMYLHMPPGGRPLEKQEQEQVKYKGALYYINKEEPEPTPLQGSLLGFTKNGEWQGAAFTDVLEGTYYPSVSLYTLPDQAEGATVTFNFGPDFRYPMPEEEGLLPPRAMCEVVEVVKVEVQEEGEEVAADGGTAPPAEPPVAEEAVPEVQAAVVEVGEETVPEVQTA